MNPLSPTAFALLSAISTARGGIAPAQLQTQLIAAGLAAAEIDAQLQQLCAHHFVRQDAACLHLTSTGVDAWLQHSADIEAALDPSPPHAQDESCPSLPWLTTVQTCWTDAVSINYAVQPEALAALLPAPLQPEVFHGTGWVQVLLSSLRDLRPQGLGALFGVNFYQISYRAAVCYRSRDGTMRRGGYFLRSETNHSVMRAIGNRLAEFRFHEFGFADMLMIRAGDRSLTFSADPQANGDHGRVLGIIDPTPQTTPPPTSVWPSLAALHDPLVECYDAFGVDADAGYLYILTIDRDPWRAHFAHPQHLYCEYFDTGPLGNHVARFDSLLYLQNCHYRWRPLRREAL